MADIPAERGEAGGCCLLFLEIGEVDEEREGARAREFNVPRDPFVEDALRRRSGLMGT